MSEASPPGLNEQKILPVYRSEGLRLQFAVIPAVLKDFKWVMKSVVVSLKEHRDVE